MVPAMVRCPPQRPLLQGAATETGDKELHQPAGLVGTMGEVAVITGRDAEHAGEIEDNAQDEGGSIDASEEHSEASQVQTDERNTLEPVGDRRGAGLRGLLVQQDNRADSGSDGRANETLLMVGKISSFRLI